MATAGRSGDNLARTIWNIITKHKLTDLPVVVVNKQDVSGAPSKDGDEVLTRLIEKVGHVKLVIRHDHVGNLGWCFSQSSRRVRYKIKMQGFSGLARCGKECGKELLPWLP